MGIHGERTAGSAPVPAQSFCAWREAARVLLACEVAPRAIDWAGAAELFTGAPCGRAATHNGSEPAEPSNSTLHLPRKLIALLQSAACCRVPGRWALLYQVLWRWRHGDRAVLSAADADGARLQAMVGAVRREEQAMRAKIRFRERADAAGGPRFVAWCEPAHDVLPQLAEHYVRQMEQIGWMIATPEASVLWDGQALHDTGPPLQAASGLDEATEAPWLAYYRGAAGTVCVAAKRPPAGAGAGGGPAPPDGEHPASLDQCRRCDLWKYATQPVGGAGPKRARIMLVGEQPGDQEDLAGEPFVGPAGGLLDRALQAAGLDRNAVYLTNAVKHFKWEPRGKRRMHKTPAQREVEACSYWLDKELAQVRPAVVVALGSTALKAVLGNPHATLKDVQGHPVAHGGRWVVAVYHPSYALRVPDSAARTQAFAAIVEGLKLARDLAKRGEK